MSVRKTIADLDLTYYLPCTARGRTVGGTVAHAVGAGVRVDVAVFSFIERATLRFDVAKTINDATPFQFWFGVQHAY